MTSVAKHGGKALHPLRLIGWSLVGAVLLVPLIAMQFTQQVAWTPSDFLFAGLLLIGGGAMIELAVRRGGNRVLALGACAVVLLAVLLIWADGAVGVF